MKHRIVARRIVPMDAAKHAGEKAICVQLFDGRKAWGFGGDWKQAEADAVKTAEEI